MNRKSIGLMAVILALLFCSAHAAVNIVPKPKSLTLGTGTFTVPATVSIWSDGKSDTALAWLRELLKQANRNTTIAPDQASAQFKVVFLQSVPDTSTFGAEGYSLVVNSSGVTITAPTATGQFYAVMTLRQMFPPEVELRSPSAVPAAIALDAVTIVDKPRYSWRSTQADPARSWIPLSYLYVTADRLALFKMNVFHLHLTDDQGWRIEMPKYPNLTIKGASTQIGGAKPPAGTRWYYTQDEMRAFVRYCADRHITVLPEIDMPGHMQAAIASYPSMGVLGSTGVRTSAGISADYLKIGSVGTAEVDTFISNVLKMCADVFSTSEYIHIGGDECTSTPLADYAAFIRATEKKVRALGRKMIGWDEIAQLYGGQKVYQDPTTLFVPWQGSGAGDVIAWCRYLYLDMCNKNGDPGCYTWCASQITLQTIYTTPMTNSGSTARGVDSPLWGEMLSTFDQYNDRQFWPRVAAVAEIGWVPTGTNTAANWTGDFKNRIAPFGCRFDRMGMKWYTNDGLVTWQRCAVNPAKSSAFDNFVPVKNWVDVGFSGLQRGGPAIQPAGDYRIFDLQGRCVGRASGADLRGALRSRTAIRGVYLAINSASKNSSHIIK